ncbi:hypothetical protein PCAR4_110040 [Paraburkholderia caribensis]|nr:hypothetical protein PCAR4_110040 [Paraburkholderia caribensis]
MPPVGATRAGVNVNAHAREPDGVVQGALADAAKIGSFAIALTGACSGVNASALVSVFVSALVSAIVRLNSHRAHRALSCALLWLLFCHLWKRGYREPSSCCCYRPGAYFACWQ